MSAAKLQDAFALDAGVPAIEGAIRPQPRFADRISKRVLSVVFGVVILMVGTFFAALDAMDSKKQKHAQEVAAAEKSTPSAAKTTGSVVPKEFTDAPNDERPTSRGLVKPSLVETAPAPNSPDLAGLGDGSVPSLKGSATGTQAGKGGGTPMMDNGLGQGSTGANSSAVSVPTVSPEQKAAEVAKIERARRMTQARSTGLSVKSYQGDDKSVGGSAASTAAASLLTSLKGQPGATSSGGQQVPGALLGGQGGQRSDSEQDEKASFLKNAASKDEQSYLPRTQMSSVSANELRRGSYVPLRLETAINSDQPGMVNARVTEDVYDTKTGCRLLLPAMTVVQGVYDSKVAMGQTRNLVAWNYLAFEDGSHLDLGAMQGYDSSGAAGIDADVDNHYIKLFGMALGMSLVTAAVQQSTPVTSTTTTAQTPQQSLATALAQNYGQLGSQIFGKQLAVQPTLKNYPGERFVIMLPLNVVLTKVWGNRCGAGS